MTGGRPLGPSTPSEYAAEVRALVDACRACTKPKELLQHCEDLFRLLCNKKIELEVPYSPSGFHPGQGEGENAAFIEWLHQSFEVFVSIVFGLLESEEAHIQQLGLSYLFRIIKHEAQVHRSSTFPLSVFQFFISRLLQTDSFTSYLQQLLQQNYAQKYVDIRYYLFVVVLKILREFIARKENKDNNSLTHQTPAAAAAAAASAAEEAESETEEGKETEWYVWKIGEAELSSRLTSLLLQLADTVAGDRYLGKKNRKRTSSSSSSSNSNSKDEDNDMSEDEEDEASSVSEEDEKNKEKTFIHGLSASKALHFSNHRTAFQSAWLLLLLHVQHSSKTLQQLLQSVPRRVLPLLSNPILLADFFLNAFAISKQISHRISALSGLFFLLTKHRLGDPELVMRRESLLNNSSSSSSSSSSAAEAAAEAGAHFYQQLYRLLTPAAFAARLRSRFLRLLNIALRSDMLPTCLIACFIKKCCRVACIVSPAASLSLQALAASLLHKYFNTCKPLVSIPSHVAATLRISGDAFDYCSAKIRKKQNAHTAPAAAAAAAAAAGSAAAAGEGAAGWRREGGGGLSSFSSGEEDDDELLEEEEEENAVLRLAAAATPARLRVNTKKDITPLARKEAKISLWEISLLKKHALLPVQQLACIFNSDFSNPACKKVELEDFLNISTGALLAREVKAINKPSSLLFPISSANADTTHKLPDVLHLHAAAMNIANINSPCS